MRNVPRFGVPFVLLLLVALSLVSTGKHPLAARSPLPQQTLWGPYWTAQPGFTSTLEMKNNLVGQALNVSVSLYLADGAEFPLDPLQLGPRQTVIIDVSRALAGVPNSSGPQTAREGTLEVSFDGPTPSALMGSVSIRNPGQGIAWNFFLYARRDDPTVVPLRGLFWFQNSKTDGFIALDNASEQVLSLTPRLEMASGSFLLPQITLRAGLGTKLELRKELHKLGLDEVTAGGIEFTWQGEPDALKAHGALFDGHGFSAEVDFVRFESSTDQPMFHLRTPSFALGNADPRLGLARTIFDPTVALHNFDSYPLDVTLTVGYPEGTTTQQINIPLSLGARETRVFSLLPYLKTVLSSDVPWASLQVSYSDSQNALVGAMVSVSEDGHHSIRSVLNWTHGNLREGWYWSADANHDTFLSILNTDTENAQLAISLDYYAEGTKKTYNLPERTLSPGASSLVDIGRIIASGQPDADGNIIPAAVTFGGYRVRKVGHRLWPTITTEALAFDRSTHNFLTFYNTCCGMQQTKFSPDSFLGPVGALGSVTVMQQDYCSQQWVQVTSGCTFSSGNTAVATVDQYGSVTGVSPGSTTTTTRITFQQQKTVDTCINKTLTNPTPTDVLINLSCTPTNLALGPTAPSSTTNGSCTTSVSPSGGMYTWTVNKNTVTLDAGGGAANYVAANPSSAQGDTMISVTYTVNGQSATAQSSPITVHKPSKLVVTSDPGSTQNFSCSGYCGVQRLIQYKVFDSLGPIPIAGLPAVERFTPGSNTCSGVPGTPTPGNGVTLSDGSFNGPDQFAMCSPSCLPPVSGTNCSPTGSCTVSFTQVWSVAGVDVRTNAVSISCTQIQVTPQ